MRIITTSLLSLFLLSYCGVEAGNPTGKKPKSSASVSFVNTSSSSGDQFTMPLDSISLVSVSSDSSESSLQSLTLSNQEVTLLNGDSSSTTVAQADVEVGSYSGVFIKLPNHKPPRYRAPDGTDTEVGTDALDQHGFRIDQSIEVKEGESTSIVIRIDPIGSLSKDPENSGHFKFDPRGDAFPQFPMAKYDGTTTVTDAVYVCAYGYGLSKPPHPPMDKDRPMPPPGQMPSPPPGASFGARHHTSYATRVEIVFDATSVCANAFTKTDIKDQAYVLDHIPPGSYALRFFKADDSYVDQSEDIKVSAPNP